ncbi:MAG: flagellar motor switch protein FliG, partial [Rhodospirillales bacterium]
MDYRTLKGPQKAAIFMLAVGDQHASILFEMMEDEEIRELSQTMSQLGTVDADVVERLFVEFADSLSSTGGLIGSYESTERLLYGALDEERVKGIMEEIRGPAGRTMWEKLENVNEAVLANYFKNEYPQTVAVVMSKIKADHAARVLGLLPENFSMEVIMRMLRMEAVQKEVLDNIEKTLRTEFMTNLARTARRDIHEMIADIINALDRGTETRFMTALEEHNRESAEKIKALMFTFDDLSRLDDGGIQVLMRQVEKDQLAMALKGASDEVRDMFFRNMSERASKMMKEDMDAMGVATGIKLPYIVTMDEGSGQILSVVRNWRETDMLRRKRQYFVHYKFLPGFG